MSISVIIPAYNRADLLPMTLHSLLAQSVAAEEIIVVDDGSTDDTAGVAESFGTPVRVIRQANAGPGAARNRGFQESTGEFIHFFDSDDVALSNKHEVQLRALQQSGADIAYCPWVKGRFSDRGFIPDDLVLQQHGLPDGDLIKALLTNWSVVPHACLFRRTIVEKAGGFPEHLFGTEDQLMFLNCLLAGAKVVHSPGTLELYRSGNSGKITGTEKQASVRHICEWTRFLEIAAGRCQEHGIDPRSWFGFRRRVWIAINDLRQNQINLPESVQALQKILEPGWPFLCYRIEEFLQQKRLGMLQRIGCGRAHPCFKAGVMDAVQKHEFENWLRSLSPASASAA